MRTKKPKYIRLLQEAVRSASGQHAREQLLREMRDLLRHRAPHRDKVDYGDHLRDGRPYVLDKHGRVWTHPRFSVMLGSLESAAIFGPAPFDYLGRCGKDERSGWVLLADSVDGLGELAWFGNGRPTISVLRNGDSGAERHGGSA